MNGEENRGQSEQIGSGTEFYTVVTKKGGKREVYLKLLSVTSFSLLCLHIAHTIFYNRYYEPTYVKQSEPITIVLPKMSVVSMYRFADHAKWLRLARGDTPQSTEDMIWLNNSSMKPDKNFDKLQILQRSSDFHRVPRGDMTDNSNLCLHMGAGLFTTDFERHYFFYIPSTGELGWRDMWVTTPPEFQAWVRELVRMQGVKQQQ